MRKSPKAKATEFETRVVNLLKKMQFDDVDGARDDFMIGGIQVDACGGKDDNLLVIECTRREDLMRTNLRSKIAVLKGFIPGLRSGFKRHLLYKKYRRLIFLLITENIQMPEENLEFAQHAPKVILWDNNVLDYYDELFSKIGKYALYDMLGELEVRKSNFSERLAVHAFKTSFGSVDMYQFMLNPKELLEFATVARREMKGERNYQREVKENKIGQIAEYIDEGNFLPNNIIMAFDEKVGNYVRFYQKTMEPLPKKQKSQFSTTTATKYGVLSFPKDYRSCWVIDGQHRLYAFSKVKNDINVPIVIFDGLKGKKAAKIFLDINKNQKSVPPELVWDLNGDLIPDDPDGIISRIAKVLNANGNLMNKISMPSEGLLKNQTGRIRISNLCITLKRLKLISPNTKSNTANPMYKEDPDQVVKAVSKQLSIFYGVMKDLFKEDWDLGNKGFVLDNSSGNVMLRIFELIVSHSVKKHQALNEEYYKKYLLPLIGWISGLDSDQDSMKKAKSSVTSEAGKDEYSKLLVKTIRDGLRENDFGGDVSFASADFTSLEKRLKELIRKKLYDGTENWFENNVSKEIFGQSRNFAQKWGVTKPSEFYQHMTFGQVIGIMNEKREMFYPIFSEPAEGFGGKSREDKDARVRAALSLVNEQRTLADHAIGVDAKKYDELILDPTLRKLNACLDRELGSVETDEDEEETGEESET